MPSGAAPVANFAHGQVKKWDNGRGTTVGFERIRKPDRISSDDRPFETADCWHFRRQRRDLRRRDPQGPQAAGDRDACRPERRRQNQFPDRNQHHHRRHHPDGYLRVRRTGSGRAHRQRLLPDPGHGGDSLLDQESFGNREFVQRQSADARGGCDPQGAAAAGPGGAGNAPTPGPSEAHAGRRPSGSGDSAARTGLLPPSPDHPRPDPPHHWQNLGLLSDSASFVRPLGGRRNRIIAFGSIFLFFAGITLKKRSLIHGTENRHDQ
ncbi:hypothetical protein DESC_90042 [Desulfosarcina cetonica]|nr:hypothetical protein DESC_90042 [Desulfosarcina cetonica]